MAELTLQRLFKYKELGDRMLGMLADAITHLEKNPSIREARKISLNFSVFENDKQIPVLRAKLKKSFPGPSSNQEILMGINLSTDKGGQIGFDFPTDPETSASSEEKDVTPKTATR